MFYPAHTPYHAEWTTENGCVEMYALEFDTDFFSLFHRDFSVIKAPPLADSFLSLLQGFENKNDLQALQAFYTILSYAAEHIPKTDTVTDTILPALEWLREENDDFKVKDLAALCFVSESRFYTLFKKATGYSPVDYKNLLKLHRALPLLRSGATVEEICDRLHFCSPCYFRRLLRKFFNKTPSQLKNETPRV